MNQQTLYEFWKKIPVGVGKEIRAPNIAVLANLSFILNFHGTLHTQADCEDSTWLLPQTG